jgi:hypothetical protein
MQVAPITKTNYRPHLLPKISDFDELYEEI